MHQHRSYFLLVVIASLEVYIRSDRSVSSSGVTDDSSLVLTPHWCRLYPVEVLIDSLPQTPLLSQDQLTNLIAVARQVEQQAWMRHFITLNYKDDMKAIRCPVLALNGERDLQVIARPNLAILKPILKKNKRSKIVRYPQLNHLVQTCRTGLPDEYGQIEETIAPVVLDDIVRWIISLK